MQSVDPAGPTLSTTSIPAGPSTTADVVAAPRAGSGLIARSSMRTVGPPPGSSPQPGAPTSKTPRGKQPAVAQTGTAYDRSGTETVPSFVRSHGLSK